MSAFQPKKMNSAVSTLMRWIWNTPPPERSRPNVGVRFRPRLAATAWLWRSRSSSGSSVRGALSEGAAPRARRRASRNDEKSPSAGVSAGATAAGGAGGGMATGAGCGCAMTGGVLRGRGAALVGAARLAGGDSTAGATSGEGGGLVARLGSGASCSTSGPPPVPRSACSSDSSCSRGCQPKSTTACKTTDSTNASRIVGTARSLLSQCLVVTCSGAVKGSARDAEGGAKAALAKNIHARVQPGSRPPPCAGAIIDCPAIHRREIRP